MKKISDRLDRVKPLFAPMKLDYVFDSIAEGLTPAEVYVDDSEDNPTAIVHEGCNFYLGGGVGDLSARKSVDFFWDRVLDGARRQKLGIAKLFYPSSVWKDTLEQSLTDMEHRTAGRILLRHPLAGIPSPMSTIGDFLIKEMTGELLGSGWPGVEGVIEEVTQMWGSPERFLQHGFGFCALKEQELVSWCTTEYHSRAACGVGVETAEEHQNRGISTALVSHVLERCRQLGLTPYWDSWKKNTPSVRVAQKSGFEVVREYEVIFVKS